MVITDYVAAEYGSSGAEYTFIKNEAFHSTSYKALYGNTSSGLLRCHRYRVNGKIKLLYHSPSCRSLAASMNEVTENMFFQITASIFKVLLDLRHNGFLSASNLDVNPEAIFIDIPTLTAHMIHIPIHAHSGEQDVNAAENKLRQVLARIINGVPVLSGAGLQPLCADLLNPQKSIAQIAEFLKVNADIPVAETTQSSEKSETLRLVATGNISDREFAILKQEYIIGKKADSVDGLIDYSNAVSRTHCKVITSSDGSYVSDLGSSNGTYLDGERLLPNKSYKLQKGALLKIANCEFRVEF